MIRIKEDSLYSPVAGYAKRKSYRWQVVQLQFFEYRIDLYGFSRVHDSTIAIELKVENWKRAIEQALVYQLCADYVWIALPVITVPRVEQRLLAEHGIGLLSVDLERGRCASILPPRKSHVIRRHYRDDYVAFLLGSE